MWAATAALWNTVVGFRGGVQCLPVCWGPASPSAASKSDLVALIFLRRVAGVEGVGQYPLGAWAKAREGSRARSLTPAPKGKCRETLRGLGRGDEKGTDGSHSPKAIVRLLPLAQARLPTVSHATNASEVTDKAKSMEPNRLSLTGTAVLCNLTPAVTCRGMRQSRHQRIMKRARRSILPACRPPSSIPPTDRVTTMHVSRKAIALALLALLAGFAASEEGDDYGTGPVPTDDYSYDYGNGDLEEFLNGTTWSMFPPTNPFLRGDLRAWR